MEEQGPSPNPANQAVAALPAWQRRIVLAMLVGLLALGAKFELNRSYLETSEWFEDHYPGTSYVLLVIPSLLAVWAALCRQPLAVRLPPVLMLAAVLGLIVAWEDPGSISDPTSVIFFPVEVLFLTALLTMVRRLAGWQIGLEHEEASSETGKRQFSLRQLLTWIAATAVILSLTRWLTSEESWSFDWEEWIFFTILGLGLFRLLWIVPCVGFVLCPGSRRRLAAWMVGMVALEFAMSLAVIFTDFCHKYLVDGKLLLEYLAPFAGLAGLATLEPLLTTLGTLWVFRLCGYRLVRRKDLAAAAPLPLGPRPAWRKPFPYLVAALGLLALALVWLAVQIEQGKKREIAYRAIEQKFLDCNMRPHMYHGELRFLWYQGSLPDQPISDQGLQLVRQYADRRHGVGVVLNNCQMSDAQLADLADLPLWRLDLVGNPISNAGLAQLQHPEALILLDLSKTQITDDGLSVLQGCEHLTHLGLEGTQITDAGLKHLQSCPKLQYLSLDGTQITDAGLKHLQQLTDLARLRVIGTQITEEGKAELTRALPGCRVLPGSPGNLYNVPLPPNRP